MRNEIRNIEEKMNLMAAKIMKGEVLESFLKLPIDGKIAGIGFFASLVGDEKVIEMCDHAVAIVNG